MDDTDELPEIHILAINTTQRLAIAEEGLGDIRSFLDDEWDEVENKEEAAHASIEWRFGGWSTVDLDDYEDVKYGLN